MASDGVRGPHGVGDTDKVRPGKEKSLKLGTRYMASEAELLQRPMPEANVAPDTKPCAPPAPLQGAPAVTSREQVIPAHSSKTVAVWWRKLVRCVRAAGRGDLELARSLRPADEWLEHALNSVPATAPWDWDLRPL